MCSKIIKKNHLEFFDKIRIYIKTEDENDEEQGPAELDLQNGSEMNKKVVYLMNKPKSIYNMFKRMSGLDVDMLPQWIYFCKLKRVKQEPGK